VKFDVYRPILSGLFGALITVALIAWIRRSKPQVQDGGVLVLRYPRALAVFGLIMGGVFGAFAVRNAIYGSAVSSYIVALTGPLVLAIGGLYLATEAFFVRVVVSDTAVRVSSLWSAREVLWSDITSVSHGGSEYVLHSRNAGRLKVSTMLVGSSAFLERLREHGHADL
jgi:hypothetical protein